MSLLLACICQIVIVFSIFIVGQSLRMYGTSLPFVPLFSGVCLYVEVYRKNCPNTIGFQFSTNESTLHEYLLGDQSAEGLKHFDLQIHRSWAIQKYTANQTSSKKRSNTRKSEYIRCSRCSKLVSPFLGYRTSKVVYSYNVRLPANTRHPSCTKLPCPRLLHPHPAGGELEKFRERLYQFIPTQKTSIYSNNTEAYSNQFSTSMICITKLFKTSSCCHPPDFFGKSVFRELPHPTTSLPLPPLARAFGIWRLWSKRCRNILPPLLPVRWG